MVVFNPSKKEIGAKIVYYGPAAGGKTTNLHHIHSKLNPKQRGDLISLATKDDRTLFFDFLPLDVGMVKGFKVRFHLYTVPGQVYYVSTRRAVLTGVDGVVFVADSQEEKLAENMESLEDLEKNLQYYGKKIDQIPMILQYNKRDLKNISTLKELNARLNTRNLSHVEAVAVTGKGVMETLTAISKAVLESLEDPSRKPKAKPAVPPPPKTEAKPETGGMETLIELESDEKVFDIEKLRAERRATIDKLLKQQEMKKAAKKEEPPTTVEERADEGATEAIEHAFKEEDFEAEIEMSEEGLEFGEEAEEGIVISDEQEPSEFGEDTMLSEPEQVDEESQTELDEIPLELEDAEEWADLETDEEALTLSAEEELAIESEAVPLPEGEQEPRLKTEGLEIVDWDSPEKIFPASIKLPLTVKLPGSTKETKISITIHLEEIAE